MLVFVIELLEVRLTVEAVTVAPRVIPPVVAVIELVLFEARVPPVVDEKEPAADMVIELVPV